MDGESIGEKGRERPSEAGSPPTKRRLPWLIISLIMLNWALFFYSLYKNNCPSQTPRRDKCVLYDVLGRLSFQPLQENAQFGPAMSTLVDLGGFRWNFKRKETKKWHILSSIFFHTGVASLILDTVSLLYMGMKLEQNFGIVMIGSLFFLSSLGGSLWACLDFKGSAYVGGPSGVCGLTGGAFAELLINFNMHDQKFKRFLSLCFGVAINFTITLFPRVNISGYVGGLYMGFLLGFLLLIRCQQESAGYESKRSGNYSQYQRVLWSIALISTVLQFIDCLIKFILH